MKKRFIATIIAIGLLICNVYAVENNTSNNGVSSENNQNEEEIKVEDVLYEGVPITYSAKYLTRVGCVANIMDPSNILFVPGAPYEIKTGFKDVKNYSYNSNFDSSDFEYRTLRSLAFAQKKKVVTGYTDGTFRPNEKITKEDMYLMMYRLAISGIRYDAPQVSEPDITILDTFSDGDEISPYAREGVSVMIQMGFYDYDTDSNILDPKGNILVEDAKKVFEKFYEFYVPDASESE